MPPSKKESAKAWNIVSDIYDSSTPNISRLLRSKTLFSSLHYRDRIFIGTFCYMNGVDPKLLQSALYLNENLTSQKLEKILDLYNYFNGSRLDANNETDGNILFERRKKYFSYSIYERKFVDLNNNTYNLRK